MEGMRTGFGMSQADEMPELDLKLSAIVFVHLQRALSDMNRLLDEARGRGMPATELAMACLRHSVMTSVYADEFEGQMHEAVSELREALACSEDSEDLEDSGDLGDSEGSEGIDDDSEMVDSDGAAEDDDFVESAGSNVSLDECLKACEQWDAWTCDNAIHERLKHAVDNLAQRLPVS